MTTSERARMLWLAVALCLPAACAMAHVKAAAKAPVKATLAHSFGVIGHSFGKGGGAPQLELSLGKMNDDDLVFVVAVGVKGKWEGCSDALYTKRRDMIDKARRPVVVLPAASDWADCKNSAGRPLAVERLNRLRETLYPEAESLGKAPLELSRMSSNPTFRSYAENAYWVHRKVLYATVNVPSNNNLFRPEAGRNNEYEDRMVANRFWINRLFEQARRKKLEAVVLFTEGDIGILTEKPGMLARFRARPTTQDGYAPVRRQIDTLAEKFTGKVLLVDTAPSANGTEPLIAWKENVGHVSIGARAMHVQVSPEEEPFFSLDQP